MADVQWGEINTDDLPLMDFDEEARSKFRLQPGDLLVNEGGSYPGRCAIWSYEIECYYQKALHRLRPRDTRKDTPRFFYYVMFFAASAGAFVAGGNEATIEHLPAEKLQRYRFAFPPMAEQEAIADLLDADTKRIGLLMIEAQAWHELAARTPIRPYLSRRDRQDRRTQLHPESARMSLHKEIHFEVEIAEHLGPHGWVYEEGVSAQYDRGAGVLPEDVIAWVQESQPEAWQALAKGHGTWSRYPAARPAPRCRLDTRGTLDVLRNGDRTSSR